MGKAPLSLLIISLILIGPLCYSQTSVKVSDPRLEMNNNIITISYDILNSKPEESYDISIEIKDEAGKIIDARSFNGDIGDEVSGGSNKQIYWNLEADDIFLDAYIVVQINAKVNLPPAPVIVEPVEDPVHEAMEDLTITETEGQKQEDIVTQEEAEEPAEITKAEESKPASVSRHYNRTGIVLQSLAFPGLGLSRVTGNPHWIRGVAGYGCIAGSIVLNRQATDTYNGIDDLVYFDDINAAYNEAVKFDNISQALAYTAIGIWVADFIWTLVGTSDMNEGAYNIEPEGFSFGSNIDPLTHVPLATVRYRF
jgi:hypothetical protein